MQSEFPEHFASWQAAESCWRSVNSAIEKSIVGLELTGETSLSKHEASDILSALAITMVMWGQDSITDDFDEEDGVGGTRGDIGRPLWRDLTELETQVARMILSGAPNKNIAVTLDISLRAVDRRRQIIFTKFGASSALEFAEIAANTSKRKTVRTKYSGETTAIESVNRTNIGRLKAIVCRRLTRVFAWDEIKALKYLDETIRRFTSVGELGLLEAEEDAFKWRHSIVRNFLAASWMVRHATPDDQQWFSERQYSALNHSKGTSRFPQLKFVWIFICATPDNALLARADDERHGGRWNTLVQSLFSRPLHSRSTELMYLAWPGLLRRAGYLEGDCTNEESIQLASDNAQETVAAGFASSGPENHEQLRTTALQSANSQSVEIIERFLSEYLNIRSEGDWQSRIVQEDFEDQLRDCDAVPGKPFRCGHADEADNPLQNRKLTRSFRLCAYAVTNRFYRLFDAHHARRIENYRHFSPYARSPAIHLSWFDAWTIALWCHGSLPTEWEWEYAARGSLEETTELQPKFVWGDDLKPAQYHAWTLENSDSDATHFETKDHLRSSEHAGNHARIVGQLNAGHFQLHDMAGNVWEWCANRYETEERDIESSELRSCRGGSYSQPASFTGCSLRNGVKPSETHHDCGARIARKLE